MRKSLLAGAVFGLLLIAVAALGLVFWPVETATWPFTFLPRAIVDTAVDTATTNGGISMSVLALASAALYATVFGIIQRVMLHVRVLEAWASAAGPS